MKYLGRSQAPTRHVAAALAVFIGLMLQMSIVQALGLGAIELKSAINQPLLAEIVLPGSSDLSADQIVVTLGTAEDFKRAGISRDFLYTTLQYTLVKAKSGGLVLQITTQDLIREPALNFVLRVQSPDGSVTRVYTVLLSNPK